MALVGIPLVFLELGVGQFMSSGNKYPTKSTMEEFVTNSIKISRFGSCFDLTFTFIY